MDILGLVKYFHLENDIEKQIELHDYSIDRLELSAMYLLDEAEKRSLPYAQALELCFLCKDCLGLTGKISNPITGKKKAFGNVLLTAALALQEKIRPAKSLRIKNKQDLESFIPFVKNLEDHASAKLPPEADFRAFIRLAMIVDYDINKLMSVFKEKYPQGDPFKSAFAA